MMLVTLSRLLGGPFRKRQERLMLNRAHANRDIFIDHANDDFERCVAIKLWDHLRGWAIPNFQPQIDDDLLKVYGIAEEELDEDILINYMKIFEISVPSKSSVYNFGPINTPLGIIRFLSMARNEEKARNDSGDTV